MYVGSKTRFPRGGELVISPNISLTSELLLSRHVGEMASWPDNNQFLSRVRLALRYASLGETTDVLVHYIMLPRL